MTRGQASAETLAKRLADIDHIAIERAIDWDRTVTLTITERTEAVCILNERGMVDREIGDRLGITFGAVLKIRQRNGIATVGA